MAIRAYSSEQANGFGMAIYGYARVSTQAQATDGESLGVQERQIVGWAMIRGEEVTEVFVERAISGSVPIAKRPEGSRLWRCAKKGDTIVVARLDRLFRSALDALQSVEEMAKRGVEIHVIEGLGNITGNGMGKAFMTIAATFAELERATIGERIASVKADQRARGRYLGGKVPFGYRIEGGELLHDEEEQRIIARAKKLRPTGPSGRSLRFIQDEIKREFGRTVGLATLQKIVSPFVPSGVRRRMDGGLELHGPKGSG
jgi:putative DNA-invertase from lambdoid prophage Rac